jgi:hypothetical protein
VLVVGLDGEDFAVGDDFD